MRFFCRFNGEEAAVIKSLFRLAGIGGEGQLSLREFTKIAVRKELKILSQLTQKKLDELDEKREGAKDDTE